MLKIYFKNNCSTCQTAYKLIRENTREEVQKVEYLTDTPSPKEIRDLLRMLGMKAGQLVRKKEKLYKEKYEGKKLTNAQWVDILHRNPILIERPIVVDGRRALIGRPAHTVIEFVKPPRKTKSRNRPT